MSDADPLADYEPDDSATQSSSDDAHPHGLAESSPEIGTGDPVEDPDADAPGARSRLGSYTGDYEGIKNCWYSSDGYVYDAAGNRVGVR